MKKRCGWAGEEPLMIDYHDREWGVPLHDDRKLFELLILEGMQAGLTWRSILTRRDSFRMAFDDFDPIKIAKYDSGRIEKLMGNSGIIRNRLKIESSISNARAFLAVAD
jgi:DNA-3-methyladenine glycosylase I